MSVRPYVAVAVPGLLLGLSLSHIGFGDFGEVHRMFTLEELRLVGTFAAGVALTGFGMALYPRRRELPQRLLHRGTVVGALLFGAGWALCGACPSIALVQLGEGRLYGLVTLAGVLLGTAAGGRLQQKARLPADSC